MAWNNTHLLSHSAEAWRGLSWILFPAHNDVRIQFVTIVELRGSSIFSGAGKRRHSDISPSFIGLSWLGQAHLRGNLIFIDSAA